ncbi:hypothetical protein VRRI112168_17555 [Vreelandella rituensis]|nr:hypothetical protein [Halomonas rituensis]
MAIKKREPLSEEELDYLVQLANGNALARQRKHDREKALRNNRRDKQAD